MTISQLGRTVALVAALVGPAACSSDAQTSATDRTSSTTEEWPNSMVVLGHSGATGYNSDPANPGSDAIQNSWATGDNPQVDSIYARALAQNPALEGNNFNLAVDGSTVSDLPRQVDAALALAPLPDLFIIQAIDNDIRCDGTDHENYEPYGAAMSDVLASINAGAPDAQIFVVGLWATVENYTDVTQQIPAAIRDNQGGGPCDVFDASGNKLPEVMTYFQDVIDHYQAQLNAACDSVATCVYAGDAIRNMVITADDLTADTYHLAIAGQAKMANTAWTALVE
ncbi:MAG TPA: SGNH/GDSL hydrolase family protein [Ilumatobacteraceae bacterium]|nr:SGNH/GDSL hydrolase family protein [Ilumatobacteraceae bacterium]